MAREFAVVVDVLSPEAVYGLGAALRDEGVEVVIEAEGGRLWCFAGDEPGALAARELVLRLAAERPEAALREPPSVRVWNDARHRYVDPAAPDEEPDGRDVWIEGTIAPSEVTWQVRPTLSSAHDFRRVRQDLPRLGRPVIATGRRRIDLGARDFADAEAVAERAAAVDGVVRAQPLEIRGRFRKWLVRQRLGDNYTGGAYGYTDLSGLGSAGGGGHGGHHGHGGHGHH